MEVICFRFDSYWNLNQIILFIYIVGKLLFVVLFREIYCTLRDSMAIIYFMFGWGFCLFLLGVKVTLRIFLIY